MRRQNYKEFSIAMSTLSASGALLSGMEDERIDDLRRGAAGRWRVPGQHERLDAAEYLGVPDRVLLGCDPRHFSNLADFEAYGDLSAQLWVALEGALVAGLDAAQSPANERRHRIGVEIPDH